MLIGELASRTNVTAKTLRFYEGAAVLAEPCAHVTELLDAKAHAVTCRIAELKSLKAELDRLGKRAAGVDPVAYDPRRVCDVIVSPS